MSETFQKQKRIPLTQTEANTNIGILLCYSIIGTSPLTATSEASRSRCKSNQPAIYTEPAQLKQELPLLLQECFVTQ